jgi:hypothetical protein
MSKKKLIPMGKTITMKRWLTTLEAATTVGLRNIFGSSS